MTYATEVLADSPSGYWYFHGGSTTETDQSGNSRDLTWTASPTASAILAGEGVTLAADKEASRAAEAWEQVTTWSLEWWQQSSASGAGLMAVVSRRATNDRWAVYVDLSTGKLGLVVINTSAVSSGTKNSTAAVLDGALHHCVVEVEVSGSDTLWRMYVDGAADNSGTLFTGNTPDAGSETFRPCGENGSRRFNGKIAQLAFYPSVLSGARVTAHYNAASAVKAGVFPPHRTRRVLMRS